MQGIDLVKSMAVERPFHAKWRRMFEKSRASSYHYQRILSAFGAAGSSLQVLSSLVLLWYGAVLVDRGRLTPAGVEELGQGLARTHAAGAPCFGDFRAGGGAETRFGSLGLPNDPAEDWPTFYAERRLRPLARLARDRRALAPAGVEAIERVCERLPELAGPAEPPARLHGDLWGGNVMADAGGHPWLIDPSAYGGHREIDLAMLRLFGAPSTRIFDAYEEVAPLAGGWQERVGLYQLLPLLVHALLFGGSYRASAEHTAMRYS